MRPTGSGSDVAAPLTHHRDGWRRMGLELGTRCTTLAGGVLLAAKSDGSLLQAGPASLVSRPLGDWRLSGILLTTLVGGGLLTPRTRTWRGWRHAEVHPEQRQAGRR